MPAVQLGSVTLENILNWEEEESMTIPIKKVIRKTTPTTQAEYFVRTPRRIDLTVRLTRSEKADLRDLKNEAAWQVLCDYWCTGACNEDDDSFVDYVWIENIAVRWAPEFRGSDTPWLYVINLICSMT